MESGLARGWGFGGARAGMTLPPGPIRAGRQREKSKRNARSAVLNPLGFDADRSNRFDFAKFAGTVCPRGVSGAGARAASDDGTSNGFQPPRSTRRESASALLQPRGSSVRVGSGSANML